MSIAIIIERTDGEIFILEAIKINVFNDKTIHVVRIDENMKTECEIYDCRWTKRYDIYQNGKLIKSDIVNLKIGE